MNSNNVTKLVSGNSSIIIGDGIINELENLFLLSNYSKVAVLTDSNVVKYWLPTLENILHNKIQPIIIPSGEIYKTISQTEFIWNAMFKKGLDRHSLLINIGGGVICDIGGFAASTFMRGIDFLQIPTSLLAQVDAGFGGKTGINFNSIKNGIGIFKQPIGILIDTNTLSTLPEREFIASFSEIIKHGLIQDKIYFSNATSKYPKDFSNSELTDLIKGSVNIKLKVVEEDPLELGLRKILNFGHTIGHAIESNSLQTDNHLLHGEAIAIGMVAESKISQLLGNISEMDFIKIKNSIVNSGLPSKVNNISTDKILEIMHFDKKNINGNLLFSLITEIGKAKYDVTVPLNIIKESIDYIRK